LYDAREGGAFDDGQRQRTLVPPLDAWQSAGGTSKLAHAPPSSGSGSNVSPGDGGEEARGEREMDGGGEHRRVPPRLHRGVPPGRGDCERKFRRLRAFRAGGQVRGRQPPYQSQQACAS
jgi:hypothetical protein